MKKIIYFGILIPLVIYSYIKLGNSLKLLDFTSMNWLQILLVITHFSIVIILHEFGHIIPALTFGYKIDEIKAIWKPLAVIVRINFCGKIVPFRHHFIINAGGPFINIVVGILYMAFYKHYFLSFEISDLEILVATTNLHFFVAIANLVPLKLFDFTTDGYKIFHLVFSQDNE